MSKQSLRSQMTAIREERDQAIVSKASPRRIEALGAKLQKVTRAYRTSLEKREVASVKAPKRPQRVSRRSVAQREAAELVREFFAQQPRTKLQQLRDARDAARTASKRAQLNKSLQKYVKIYRFMIEQRNALGAA